jgi:arabinose operon protein AraL
MLKPPLKDGYLFDLDGTIYLGDSLIPGARQAVEKLKELGKKVVFLSNKPIATREDYAKKLTKLGIPVEPHEVINSSFVMACWLKEQSPNAKVYVVGEPPLVDELLRAGFDVVKEPLKAEYAVIAFDRTFDYAKLHGAMVAVKAGAKFVATNPDRTCPVEGGEIPDCAAMIGAVEGATGKKVEVIVGKPSPIIVDVALKAMELSPSQCMMVGDRLETDVAMGKKFGMTTVLVLTGVTKPEHLESEEILKPDYILNNVGDLI